MPHIVSSNVELLTRQPKTRRRATRLGSVVITTQAMKTFWTPAASAWSGLGVGARVRASARAWATGNL